MGLFKKKDPISERSRALKQEIAALEAQIRELSEQNSERPQNSVIVAPSSSRTSPASRPAKKVASENFQLEADPVLAPELDIHLQKPGLLNRVLDNFRSKPASNPKLVTFLAAGSIQGLRPLRYEKRIARNRFILLSAILLVILWGVLAVFLRNN